MEPVTQTAIVIFLNGLRLGKKGSEPDHGGAVVEVEMRAANFHVEALGSQSEKWVINEEV